MHNDRMPARVRLIARGSLAALLATLVLAGCSGEGEEPDAGETTGPTETASAEPYLPVPEGVELTPQGSTLPVGDTATVAYEPRQDSVAALEITVTSLEKASFKQFVGWELTKQIKSTSPYFVRAEVTNVGDTDLGSRKATMPVPLYAVDGENRLVESSLFTGKFEPCENAAFPKRFRNGDTLEACMVYLAPDKGELAAVSFRPDQDFNPIVWEGEVVPAKKQQGKKQQDGKQRGKKQRSGDDAG